MASRPPDMTIGRTIVQTEQILAVDIMFVEGVPSLIGVSTPLDLTLAVSLTSFETSKASRAAHVIKKGMMEIISTLRSRNFVVTTIMSDGEGSIGAVATELKMLGIEIDISGAGGARITCRATHQSHQGKSQSTHESQTSSLSHQPRDSHACTILRVEDQLPTIAFKKRRNEPKRVIFRCTRMGYLLPHSQYWYDTPHFTTMS